MGQKGSRKIRRINSDTLILTDVVILEGKRVKKEKLVKLNPERLSWTNTYLAGPSKLSQFLYEVVAEGASRSRLDFTGLQVYYGKAPSPARIDEISKRLVEEDSGMWELLAQEMANDLA
jgi:hypothetical protein